MAQFQVPAFDDDFYLVDVDLDRVTFRMRFKFNRRDDAWYLYLYDPSDVLLRAGIRVVEDTPLFRLWQNVGRPAGNLIVVASGDLQRPPVEGELGEAFIPIYDGAA
jgi:hypothetical protein